ncbi:uncharacterized protein [Cherax quadricarinatus]|uniref:uncharacterized protein n=1 Tax=Cherax quadricarinatus TaxID=27406 RepID=UPI00387EB45C
MTARLVVYVGVVVLLVLVLVVERTSTHPNLNQTRDGYQSGFLYLTHEKRLKMPLGSLLILTPTLSLPMDRDFDVGFGASMTASYPFRINFDELGMTSESNTWGFLRKRREAPTRGHLAGGDREVLYKVVENSLGTVGLDGKACLLRAICEMLESPLNNHGFFGEVIQLFLSPSRSTENTEHLHEYTEAEHWGRAEKHCLRYHQGCPYSFFTTPDPDTLGSLDPVNNTTSP